MAEQGKKTDLGVLKINNEVIASISRNAALRVSGVAGIKSNTWSILKDLFNKGYHNKGISLEIIEGEVRVSLCIVVKYGVIIPEVAVAVQENIREAVESMTGLNVSDVSVSIGAVYCEQTEN
ncbi:MAG: Asp23/Gls24 family envelope stress response protein [Candidatus Omnitrophica bacterium]|nr:Asp23/Gls24 family envelope stress response protein [Candidatus Omnitrophota bacterium]